MSMALWYGKGGDDAVDLGPALGVWKAMGEVRTVLMDNDADLGDFEELTSVTGFGEQEVTPWWMRQVLEQAHRYLKEYEGATGEQALWVIDRIIDQFEEANCGKPGKKKRSGKLADEATADEPVTNLHLRYGDGDDQIDLGPPGPLWAGFNKVLTVLEKTGADPDDFDVLLSVPDAVKDRVTREWLRRVVEQGRRFSENFEAETSDESRQMIEEIIFLIEHAIGRADASRKPVAKKKPAKKKPTGEA